MMTIPMENNKESSSRELVQSLFNKNVELENNRRKAAQARIPSDPNTWQQMRENYEAIVIEDHAFSEQHDIEYALWQLHYRRIEELRALFNAALASAGSTASQNGKGPVRFGPERLTKIRSQFKTFLSEATGFYHDLMMKIRSKYGLPLGFSSDDTDNQIPMSKDRSKSSELKKGLMSCHRCLIYLGDLARYKGLYGEGDSKARDFVAASSYYMQALSLCPSNGNPHHQLAIVAGYSNDELLSIYRYFRSLAVDKPFITARDNLIIAFEKNRQNYTQLVGDGKTTKEKKLPSRMNGKGRGKGAARPSFKDTRVAPTAVKGRSLNNDELLKSFITRFVRLSGILFTRTSLETFAEVLAVVKMDLLELLSSGPDEELNFGSDAAESRLTIVRMIAILIFTVHNVNKENENQSYTDILQRSVMLQNALTGTFELVGCMVEWCNQLNDPSSSFLLPGIMVFIEWLACCPDVAVGSELEEKQMNARSFFWNKCISLLNKFLADRSIFGNEQEEETCFSNMSKYDENETANCLALSEDFELREFLPLLPAQIILDFSRKHSFVDGGNKEKIARVQRIVAAGKSLANTVRIGQEGVYFDMKLNKFVIDSEPEISDDYLLSSPLHTNLNDPSVGVPMGAEVALVPVSKAELCAEDEDEDEDEVILFRPSANEKHVDEFSLNLTSSEPLAPVGGEGKIDFGKENITFSVGHDFFLQNAINSGPLETVANVTSQSLQPVKTSTTNWAVENAPNINGLANLNLMENGFSLKPELPDHFEVSHPAALSVPYPQFVNTRASHNYTTQLPHESLPSMFDSLMSFGAATDSLPVKPSLTMPQGLKKNPISRPVRHFGPPPGFSPVPSKVMDESSKMTLINENPPEPQVDDYSWLDEYPLSSVNPTVGFSSSLDKVGPTFHSLNKSNASTGIASFPFPGKQVPSSLHVQSENQNGWQNFQFSEQMKPYVEQHQQFTKGNQQYVGPQQYQGQSLWQDSFFV